MERFSRLLIFGFLTSALALATGEVALSQEPPPRRQRPGFGGGGGFGPRLPGNVFYERDVQYGTAGERPLRLDVIRPRDESREPRPVIVWVHGGGWLEGDKSTGLGPLLPFVSSGDYVGFSIGYRLSGEAKWPAQIYDCKAAIRWIKANATKYNIDPARIGVWGPSAGGHLVSMLGTSSDVKELEGSNGSAGQSSSVACVVDFCGPSDLPNFFKSRAVGSQGALASLLGGTVEEKKAEAIAASPVAHVTKDAAPFLIMHGTDDDIVPYAQAETLYGTLKKVGADATLVKLEGAGHFFLGGEVDRRVTAFFDKYLRGRDATISSAPIKAGGFSTRIPGQR